MIRESPVWHVEAQRLAPLLESIGRRETERRCAAPSRPGPRKRWVSRDYALTSRWDDALELAERDPAAAVDRLHVREIGWQLYAMGDVGAMRDCLDLVEDATALSYVGAAWDGIGVPGGGTWWR